MASDSVKRALRLRKAGEVEAIAYRLERSHAESTLKGPQTSYLPGHSPRLPYDAKDLGQGLRLVQVFHNHPGGESPSITDVRGLRQLTHGIRELAGDHVRVEENIIYRTPQPDGTDRIYVLTITVPP